MPLAIEVKSCPAVRFDEAVLQIGGEVSMKLIQLSDNIKNSAFEIRIRSGQSVAIKTHEGIYVPFPESIISRRQINEIFAQICGNAIYCHQTEIADGCITLVGGHRAGICGRAVIDSSKTQTITDISSLCIRIAHEVPGCAENLVKQFDAAEGGVLIAGPPCSGKTTLLRDAARILAMSKNIVIVDERNELAAVYRGMPQLDVGSNSDIITGQLKAVGMLHAVRCMSPDIIICDEIGSIEEAAAVKTAFNTGVAVIAAIHCGTVEELINREQFVLLRNSGAFSKVVLLKKGLPGVIDRIVDINKL